MRGIQSKPFPHQGKVFRDMNMPLADGSPRRGYGVFSEPGSGKTLIGLAQAVHLFQKGVIASCVVLAPAGVHRQWVEQQIPQHLTPELIQAEWWRPGRKNAPNPGHSKRLQLFAINPQSAVLPKAQAVIKTYTNHPFLLIVDESHQYKNPETKRWKMAFELAENTNCRFRLLMTGTPITKTIEDLWGQFFLVDKNIVGVASRSLFRSRYFRFGGYKNKQIVGTRHLENFNALTQPHYARVRKTDIGFQPKQHSTLWFDLLPEQKRRIKLVRDDLILKIDTGAFKTLSSGLAAAQKIQQISNGWLQAEGDVPTPVVPVRQNPRIKALLDYLADRNFAEAPVAIWCRFLGDVDLLQKVFKTPWVYTGATPKSEREQAKNEWLKNGGVFIATPGAGGTGLNLQGSCTDPIYFSNSESYVERIQSEDRFHRIGTQGMVTCVDLMARGSRDEAILRNLQNKGATAAQTLGDLKEQLLEMS